MQESVFEKNANGCLNWNINFHASLSGTPHLTNKCSCHIYYKQLVRSFLDTFTPLQSAY
jgi:hypothetical protein